MRGEFNKFNNIGAQMLDSNITSHTNYLQSHFWREHVNILPSFSQQHNERH